MQRLKLLIVTALLLTSSVAFAFGGGGGKKEMFEEEWAKGVDSFGLYFGGNGQADIKFSCSGLHQAPNNKGVCDCIKGYKKRNDVCVKDACEGFDPTANECITACTDVNGVATYTYPKTCKNGQWACNANHKCENPCYDIECYTCTVDSQGNPSWDKKANKESCSTGWCQGGECENACKNKTWDEECQTCNIHTGVITPSKNDGDSCSKGSCQSGTCKNMCEGKTLGECDLSCDSKTGTITPKDAHTGCYLSNDSVIAPGTPTDGVCDANGNCIECIDARDCKGSEKCGTDHKCINACVQELEAYDSVGIVSSSDDKVVYSTLSCKQYIAENNKCTEQKLGSGSCSTNGASGTCNADGDCIVQTCTSPDQCKGIEKCGSSNTCVPACTGQVDLNQIGTCVGNENTMSCIVGCIEYTQEEHSCSTEKLSGGSCTMADGTTKGVCSVGNCINPCDLITNKDPCITYTPSADGTQCDETSNDYELCPDGNGDNNHFCLDKDCKDPCTAGRYHDDDPYTVCRLWHADAGYCRSYENNVGTTVCPDDNGNDNYICQDGSCTNPCSVNRYHNDDPYTVCRLWHADNGYCRSYDDNEDTTVCPDGDGNNNYICQSGTCTDPCTIGEHATFEPTVCLPAHHAENGQCVPDYADKGTPNCDSEHTDYVCNRAGVCTCPEGYFRENDGDCVPCSDTFFTRSPGETTAEACAACDDINPRIIWEYNDKNYCALATCPEGQFHQHNGTCIPCSATGSYVITAETCAECNGTNNQRVMWEYNGNGKSYCALATCPEGRFHNHLGNCVPCSNTFNYSSTADTCAECDGTDNPRFMGSDDNCYICTTSDSITSTRGACMKCTSRTYNADTGYCELCPDSGCPTCDTDHLGNCHKSECENLGSGYTYSETDGCQATQQECTEDTYQSCDEETCLRFNTPTDKGFKYYEGIGCVICTAANYQDCNEDDCNSLTGGYGFKYIDNSCKKCLDDGPAACGYSTCSSLGYVWNQTTNSCSACTGNSDCGCCETCEEGRCTMDSNNSGDNCPTVTGGRYTCSTGSALLQCDACYRSNLTACIEDDTQSCTVDGVSGTCNAGRCDVESVGTECTSDNDCDLCYTCSNGYCVERTQDSRCTGVCRQGNCVQENRTACEYTDNEGDDYCEQCYLENGIEKDIDMPNGTICPDHNDSAALGICTDGECERVFCSNNSDCPNGYYCSVPWLTQCQDSSVDQFDDDAYASFCALIGPASQYKNYIYTPKTMNYWSAKNWCEAQNKHLAASIEDAYNYTGASLYCQNSSVEARNNLSIHATDLTVPLATSREYATTKKACCDAGDEQCSQLDNVPFFSTKAQTYADKFKDFPGFPCSETTSCSISFWTAATKTYNTACDAPYIVIFNDETVGTQTQDINPADTYLTTASAPDIVLCE